MKQFYLLCLLSAFAVAALNQHDKAILLFGQDKRIRIKPDRMPWSAVGQILTHSNKVCTGTLVAPDVVLTAGHCFVNKKGGFDPAVRFTVGLWGAQRATTSKVRKVKVSRAFLKGLSRRKDGVYIPADIAAHDYAFLRLSTPLGRDFGFIPVFNGDYNALRQVLDSLSWHVTQAGYPEDDATYLRVHQHCQVTGLLVDGRLSHRCATLSGNSGSPLLIVSHNKVQLVALQSSAPVVGRRKLEDNMSVSAPLFYAALQTFIHLPVMAQ